MAKVHYLTLEEVVFFHSAAIEEYGGTHGIRDITLLISALHRPRQTFGGKELYPTIWLKAAALFHGLAFNHAFVDGNKRIAITAASLFLRHNGWHLKVGRGQFFEFVVEAVAHRYEVETIAQWLERHIEKV